MDHPNGIPSELQLAAKERLHELDLQGIRYCALHTKNGSLYALDLVVHPDDDEKLKSALASASGTYLLEERETGDLKVVVAYLAETGEKLYSALRIRSRHSPAFIFPDTYRSLLASRRKVGGIWVASEDAQIIYLICELLTEQITGDGYLQLRGIADRVGRDGICKIAEASFGPGSGEQIANALGEKTSLLRASYMKAQLRNPRYSLKQSAIRLLHLFHGWFRPNGAFVIVLGPDGVGKSTTVEQLRRLLEPVFGRCVTHRWRPGAIRRVAPGTSQRLPHSRKPRGKFVSPFYAVGVFLDFCVGYFVYLRAALVRSEAIIFDRYFHDMLVDSRRYRYVGNKSLIRLLAKHVPPASPLFVILDAQEDVVLRRKQELPLEELTRQRKAYRAYAGQVQHSLIVDTSASIEDTCNSVIHQVFEYSSLKFRPKAKERGNATDIRVANPHSVAQRSE